MIKIKFLLLIMFSIHNLCFSTFSIADNDSLIVAQIESKLIYAQDDTTRLRLLLFAAENISDEKRWITYNSDAYKIGSRLSLSANVEIQKKGKEGIANSLNNLGYLKAKHGKPDEALKYFKRSLPIQREVNNAVGIAYALNNIGYIYSHLGQAEKALEYYLQSLQIQEESNNQEGIAYAYNNMARIYETQKDIKLALEYYYKALKLREQIAKPEPLSSSYNNIGLVHLGLGELDKALELFLKAKDVLRNAGEKKPKSSHLINIGLTYSRKGDFKKAMSYYKIAIEINETSGKKVGLVNALNNVGTLSMRMGEFSEALEHCTRAMKIAKEVGYPSLIRNNAKSLSMIYEELSQKKNINNEFKLLYIQQAFEFYKIFKQMADSIFNTEKSKEIGKIEGRFEFEKKIEKQKADEEAALAELNKVKNRRYTIQYSGIGFGILFLIVFLIVMGSFKISFKFMEGFVFLIVLLLFEFVMVLADPWVEKLTGGEPAFKLVFNAVLALGIFPLHNMLERLMRKILIRRKKSTK